MVLGFCEGRSSPRSLISYMRAMLARWSRHPSGDFDVLLPVHVGRLPAARARRRTH